MPSLRDNRLRLLDHFSYKLDRHPRRRGVITDVEGNQSGDGSIWADEATRIVWMMPEGASAPGQIRCALVPDPQIGLGVEWGYPEGAVEPEILSDDRFLRYSPVGNQDWVSTGSGDLATGGRQRLWLDPRLIIPLATYPSTTGLTVNVVGGDYPYSGARVTFAGQTGIALTQNPNAGEHYLVGLYLDAANTLLVVYGSSVSTSLTPPEPAWPAGAFRLSAVRINDTQTKIVLTDDISDRRMPWSDENGGGGGSWPYDKIISVSATNTGADEAAIQDVNDNYTGPASALIDPATYTETLTLDEGSIGYTGLGSQFEVSITSAGATTITVSNTFIALRYLTIRNTNAGATATCVQTGQDNTLLEFVRILKTSGAATTAVGLHVNGTDDVGTILRDSNILMAAGTTNYGILLDTDVAKLLLDGGVIEADTYDIRLNHANATLTIQNQPIFNGNGIQVVAGQIVCVEQLAVTITGPYTANTGLNGKNPAESIITASQTSTDTTLTPNASNLQFSNWTISNTGAGGGGVGHVCVENSQSGLVLDGCTLDKTTGSSTTAYGVLQSGGDCLLRNCAINVTAASTTNYALYAYNAANTIVVEGGEILAGDIVTAHASAVLRIQGTYIDTSVVSFDKSGGGTITGYYIDENGVVRLIGDYQLFMPNYPTNDIYSAGANLSDSNFVATINGTPSGTTVVYNTPSSGDETNLVPSSTSQIAKMVLHNTTQGDDALISNCNTGTNTITLTATVPGTWANGDTLTIRSQTNTTSFASATRFFVDFEIVSDIDDLAKSFIFSFVLTDSGGGATVIFHPYEADVTSKRRAARTNAAGHTLDWTSPPIPLISNRFCAVWDASGSNTITQLQLRLSAEGAALQ